MAGLGTGGFRTRPNRRSIRLQGYDYTQAGAYFITICTQGRACLFGDIVDGEMQLNEMGRCVELTWFDLPNHVHGLVLDAFVVMPNHVHGIVVINDPSTTVGVVVVVGAGSEPAPTEPAPTEPAPTEPAPTEPAPATITPPRKRHGLPEIVRQFKTFSARRVNEHRQTPSAPVWQRNYYEHIIRNDESLNRIRQYITENPLRWDLDRENPAATARQQEEAWER